ncbi:hypothetical protein ACGFXB_03185 [Streptomyces canus]|uniref:hypothetical protein n=1 Tax=Streptomyces canus TaxID=58343 RepID=UPI003715B735
MLGGWPIDENGEFRFNPTYEPALTALRYRPPENEVERTLQALDSRRGTPEALLDAFSEGTLLVSVDEDGKWRAELAKGQFGCYVGINPGSRANISIPSSDLAVSAFG